MKSNKFGLFVLICAAALLSSCTGKKIIRSDGLAYAKLGDDMPTPGIEKIKGVPVRDTLFVDQDYEWRASALQFSKGTVFVEEDFFRSEEVARIRIETPELKLRNGWRVGETVATLKKSTSDWVIAPMQRFQLFDFYSRIFPRIHFVVDDPAVKMDDPDWKSYSIDSFNPEAKVVMIVIY